VGATWVSAFRIGHPDLEQNATFKVGGFGGTPMLFFSCGKVAFAYNRGR
jgi:hypothetical protein